MAVCVTESCDRYNICGRSSVNTEGVHTARSYGTEGSCSANENGMTETVLCGPRGDYALFITKERSARTREEER